MKRWPLLLMPALVLAMAGPVSAQDDDDQSERGRRRWGRMREMMSRDDGAPKVGEEAPVFKLNSLDGKRETDLASFRGRRPVILFFGSYT